MLPPYNNLANKKRVKLFKNFEASKHWVYIFMYQNTFPALTQGMNFETQSNSQLKQEKYD